MKNIETGLFLNDFVTEAKSHVEKVENAFLRADVLSGDYQLMNSVFRAAHSLKGTAGFFSLKKIVAVAHELESVFLLIQEGKLVINDDIVDTVLQSLDCLNDLIENTVDDTGIITEDVISNLRQYTRVEAPEENEVITIPFDFSNTETRETLQNAVQHGHKMYYVNISYNKSLGRYHKYPNELIDNFFSVGVVVEAIVKYTDDTEANGNRLKEKHSVIMADKITTALSGGNDAILELLVTSVLEFDLFSIAIEVDKSHIRQLQRETVFGASQLRPDEKKKHKEDEKEKALTKMPEQDSSFYIRLNIDVINGLMDLANEMILTRNQLFSSISGYEKTIAGLPPILHDLNRLTSEIQEKVMYTRMQPISVVFDKFPRIIRDTAKSLGKEIGVNILNDDVTLDKYLLEALTDPITQLVKNSADHGLEPAELRAELRKPPKGIITLDAYMHDGQAVIEVKDDGGGIDAGLLKRKALERGVLSEEALAKMSRNEIFNLIFEPGISTAKKVTNYSGRGVGMDIVKTNIEKLGGTIEIESEIDKGTTMRLKVPLTLSVIRSLIVTIDSIPYAVPELNVERIVRIWNGTATKRIERINKSLVLSLDGRIIPVLSMKDIANKAKGIETAIDDMVEQIEKTGVIKCLVLRTGGRHFALLIDDALETEQVLVKPLPVYLQGCICYSNVTVLGSGKAVMILDADGIVRFMGVEEIEREAIDALSDESEAADLSTEEDKRKQVMLFNCSGSEYYAVDIEDISRIEVIDPGDIQEIGKESYINIAGETTRIVRPEDYSPVRKRAYNKDTLYLLNLKKSLSPVGLLIGKVIDKVDDVFEINDSQVKNDFVTGTSAYNEKVLIFLNTGAIAEDIEAKKTKNGKKVSGRGGAK